MPTNERARPSRARAPEPASGPRSRKGVQTRARLLEAAKLVFEETGFLEARISDIAQRAGLSHGSFYHYFDSKEQIFREVAEVQEDLLTAPPTAAEAAAGDLPGAAATGELTELDRIRRANRLYLQRYRANGRIMAVIEEVSRYDTHVNGARMQRQKHFADRAERAIRRLQAAGEADPGVDPEIAALALGSMVARSAELWVVEQWGEYDLDRIADQLSLLWAKAIGLDTSSHVPPAPPKRPAKRAAKRATKATKRAVKPAAKRPSTRSSG